MCRFGLLDVSILDNGTQFANTTVTNFCRDLGVQTKFVTIIHPHANGQAKLANKIILKGINKKLDDAKGLWAELLHEILWLYHNIPHLNTKKTPFTMVYRADAMLHVEIDKIRDVTHIQEFDAKKRVAKRYYYKVL